jgi:hypothetical protein
MASAASRLAFNRLLAAAVEGLELARVPALQRSQMYIEAMQRLEASMGTAESSVIARNRTLWDQFVTQGVLPYAGDAAALQADLSAFDAEAAEFAEGKIATAGGTPVNPPMGTGQTVANRVRDAAQSLRNLMTRAPRTGRVGPWIDADDEALGDAFGDAEENLMRAAQMAPNADLFSRLLARSGVTVQNARNALATCLRNFGQNQAREVFQRWIFNRIAPALGAGAAGTATGFILGQKPWEKNRADMSFGEKTQVGRWISDLGDLSQFLVQKATGKEPVYDWDKISEKIIDREILEAQDQIAKEGGGVAKKPSLNGSVLNTQAPQLPLGPSDTIIPKSEPTFTAPPSPARYSDVFSESMSGDMLSERPNDPSAQPRRSGIPPGPMVSSAREDFRVPDARHSNSLWSSGVNKRKADLAIFEPSRATERVVTQNYDNTYTTSLPANVTGPTSVEWKEYDSEFKTETQPLTEAPNVVGIGFDEASTERKMALAGAKSAIGQDSTAHHAPISAANQTNPAFKDVGKNPPVVTTRVYGSSTGAPLS